MTINYQGNDIDFKELAYQYLAEREGVRNVVYLDSYGNPTVGIGHLVTAAEGLSEGDAISNDLVQSLFNSDYDRLGIEPYAQEIQNAGYAYNMALAVSSFIWAHGLGTPSHIGYKDSTLRKGLLAGTFDANSVQTYLAENWDVNKSVNAARNAKDFAIGFSDTPWTPGFFLHRPTS